MIAKSIKIISVVFNIVFIIFLFLNFMLIWPMGHIGQGLDYLWFWLTYAAVILTNIALIIRFVKIIRSSNYKSQVSK